MCCFSIIMYHGLCWFFLCLLCSLLILCWLVHIASSLNPCSCCMAPFLLAFVAFLFLLTPAALHHPLAPAALLPLFTSMVLLPFFCPLHWLLFLLPLHCFLFLLPATAFLPPLTPTALHGVFHFFPPATLYFLPAAVTFLPLLAPFYGFLCLLLPLLAKLPCPCYHVACSACSQCIACFLYLLAHCYVCWAPAVILFLSSLLHGSPVAGSAVLSFLPFSLCHCSYSLSLHTFSPAVGSAVPAFPFWCSGSLAPCVHHSRLLDPHCFVRLLWCAHSFPCM